MLNKAILMGRLTADPELRHTPNNIAVTTFTLAVNRSFTRQGEQSVTDFIDIVAWRNTAEFICRNFRKGLQVALSGSIQTRTWKDKEGNNRKSVEIVAEEVFFADSKKDSSQPASTPIFSQPDFSASDTSLDSDFEEISGDDDLPF